MSTSDGMNGTRDVAVSQAVRQFAQIRAKYERNAATIEHLLTEWLDRGGINYLSATARAKTVESFGHKAGLPHRSEPTRRRYEDPLAEITDLVAARIITYLPESVERVCSILEREFEVREHEDKGDRQRERGLFGYASKHFLVTLDEARAQLPEYAGLKGVTFEIQVRTAAQHAWAEFEHDIRYKVEIPEARKADIDRHFLAAAMFVEKADLEFAAIDAIFGELAGDSLREATAHGESVEAALDVPVLMSWSADRYQEAGRSKGEHYDWMLGILRAVGIGTVQALNETLAAINSDDVAVRMQHRFPPGHVRRLDDDLLAALGRSYVDRQPDGGADRRARLVTRAHQLGQE